MASNVTMPKMGYDMEEGKILKWLKQEGDTVTKGEPIAEIETDKISIEIEAFASGVLAMILHGAESPVEFLRMTTEYTIKGLAQNITCPVLVCEAENDVRGGDAKPLYDAITSPKEYILFTNEEGAGEHDEAGAASLFSQRAFDWLDRTLA